MKYVDSYQGAETPFWECFPVLKEFGLFKKLYKEDRSKGKNQSSKVMWYLTLVKDVDSEFYSMDEEEQDEVLNEVLELDVEKYVGSKEELRMLLKAFEDFISCPITKSIRKLESKMVERDEFITNSKYTFDELITPTDGGKPYLSKGTSSQLDKMIRESGDLYDQIRKLRDQLKSNQSGTSKGGQEKSLIDGR